MDDFDTPNTRPGTCPECGQRANIWDSLRQLWECCLCNWAGKHPDRNPEAHGK